MKPWRFVGACRMSAHIVVRRCFFLAVLVPAGWLGAQSCPLQMAADADRSACSSSKALPAQGFPETQKQNGAQGKPEEQPAPMSFKRVFLNLPGDQKAIWTSPFHLRLGDASWLLPMAASTGVLISSDSSIMLREHSSLSAIQRSDNIANGGTIALAGVPALMYAWGSLNGYGRAKETGLLTGEALINSYAVTEAMKTVFGRERPTITVGRGSFSRSSAILHFLRHIPS